MSKVFFKPNQPTYTQIMKLLKHLLATMAIIGLSTSVIAQRVAKPDLPDRPEKPVVDKGPFGAWLDKEGFITPGPKIKNYIDTDGDRIDDRLQKAPGIPAGTFRPDKEVNVRPKPGEGGEKPETGGPDPKPEPRPFPPKPGEGGEKPGKPGEGGEKPGKPGEGGEKPGKPGEGGVKPGKPGEGGVKPGTGKPGEGGGKPKPRPKPPQPKKPTLGGNSDDKAEGKPERPERPQSPARPELSDDVKSKLDAYKKESDDLRKVLKDQLKALKNPTRDQIKKITKGFQEAQKARIDAQKELSSQIKDGLKAARPERPAKPVIPDAVNDLRKQHDETLKQVSEAKKALMQKLSAGKLSKEDHKALLDGFREGQKKLQEDMKSIQRQIREAIGKPAGDVADTKERVDRRPPPRPKPAPKTDDRRPTDR
jgi:hypothetical protein